MYTRIEILLCRGHPGDDEDDTEMRKNSLNFY